MTPAQLEAIAARGNVLVVAGAGTGKTTTLVERCLGCLLDERNPASLDEILMVTFTDAAAAEMRHRIRARLEEKLAGKTDDVRWSEQLALFDTANIGTLHSFCLQLVRLHFYELELDPQLSVMTEEEARLLAEETLETIFQAHYAGQSAADEAVRQLIQTQARGWDLPIRALVLKLHDYSQTLRDSEDWFARQLAMFQSTEPSQWQLWLDEGIADWRTRWLPALESHAVENKKAAECAAILKKLPAHPSREQYAAALADIEIADGNWPRGKTTAWRKPLEHFFHETIFLRSLARGDGKVSPLAQDWDWVRPQMVTLLELAREFTAAFSAAKKELGAVDFHDLEQHSLRLLWDRQTKQPTATALQWRKQLRYVFVDEYQDINEAQDAILKALSRDGESANRFLVGDVKQSIYRFRLADPHIFQNYIDTWRGETGRAIPLVDNFRSREAILNFVNSLFGALMRREIGSVPYDDDARLRFGDPENRAALSVAYDPSPRVELMLRLKGAGETGAAEGEGESARAWTEVLNLEESAKEARLTALRLRELKASGHLVWDESTKEMRPVEWGDMAVLLRSPSGKAECYAREFTRLGVPLTVARGGFYESLEITDLLSLLQLLDNPLQDLPLLAVLHSPLVGMTLDELAAVRLTLPKGHCWTALRRFHERSPEHAGWAKADRFLKHFSAWRRLARQVSLSRCLETVLGETHYADWLLTQPRGEQRRANVQRLLALAQQFDQFQRQGLFRFLRFIEAQQAAETEPQVAPVSGENSVALMSIHQSKGLEFPVVVMADLGKPFNLQDLRAEIILDSRHGLCPQIKPPQTGRRYPSLPYWLARQRQKQEMLGEELRLLYVAMTRARDTLILTGGVAEKKFQKHWQESADLTTASLLSARTYLDWIAAWLAAEIKTELSAPAGENSWLRWTIHDDLDPRLLDGSTTEARETDLETESAALDAEAWKKLRQRLAWKYPHQPATREPAKASVSVLRRRLAEDTDAEIAPLFKFQSRAPKLQISVAPPFRKLSATEIGTAHHTFLQLVSLEKVSSAVGLREEARRLELAEQLSGEEAAQLDFVALAEFWQSDLGLQILAQSNNVRRELEFTARFSPQELSDALPPTLSPIGGEGGGERDSLIVRNQVQKEQETPKEQHGAKIQHTEPIVPEYVVVQGAADLVVLLPHEIWLVDFKTDRMTLTDKYAKVRQYEPQLRLYSLALSKIFQRPMTQAHLHFLALRLSVKIEPSSAASNK